MANSLQCKSVQITLSGTLPSMFSLILSCLFLHNVYAFLCPNLIQVFIDQANLSKSLALEIRATIINPQLIKRPLATQQLQPVRNSRTRLLLTFYSLTKEADNLCTKFSWLHYFLYNFRTLDYGPEIYIWSAPNNSNETYTFMCLGRAGRFGQC